MSNNKWKRLGSIERYSDHDKLTVHDLVVDNLLMKNDYIGNITVVGSVITDKMVVNNTLDVCNNALFYEDVTVLGAFISNNRMEILELDVSRNVTVGGNVTVGKNAYIGNVAIYPKGSSLGIGTPDPSAAFHLVTDLSNAFAISSNQSYVKSTLSKNSEKAGFEFITDGSMRHMVRFTDSSQNSAFTLFREDGDLYAYDVPRTHWMSDFYIHPPTVSPVLRGEILNATGYASRSTAFEELHYIGNVVPLTKVATFHSPSGNVGVAEVQIGEFDNALSIVAGHDPKQPDKSFASVGFYKDLEQLQPITALSLAQRANHPTQFPVSIGINQTRPDIDSSYVIGINGAVKISNGITAISMMSDVSLVGFSSHALTQHFYPEMFVAFGNSYDFELSDSDYIPISKVYVSSNKGETWNAYDITYTGQVEASPLRISNNVYFESSSNIYFFERIQSSHRMFRISLLPNGTSVVDNITTNDIGAFDGACIDGIVFNSKLHYVIQQVDASFVLYKRPDANSLNYTEQIILKTYHSPIHKLARSESRLYVGGQQIFDRILSDGSATTLSTTYIIYDVAVKNDNTILLACQNYLILYDGTTFHQVIPSISFSRCAFVSETCAVAIGSAGGNSYLYYSVDPLFSTWQPMTKEKLNAYGNSDILLRPGTLFQDIICHDSNSFSILCKYDGYQYIAYVHLPHIFTRDQVTILNADGNSFFDGTVTIQDDVTMYSNLDVSGHATVAKTFVVDGSATFQDNVFVVNDINVSGNSFLSGNTRIFSDLFVDGSSYVHTMDVSGDLHVSKQIVIDSSANIKGSMDVSGNTRLNSSLHVGGSSTLVGLLNLVGDASLNSSLRVGGSSTIAGSLNVIGDASLNAGLRVAGAFTVAGSLNVNGDASLNSRLRVGGSSTVSGSLNLIGDASLNAGLRVGGSSTVSGSLNLIGDASLNAGLRVGGSSTVTGTLNLIGDASLNADLRVSGNTFLRKNIDISGNVVTDGILRINNTVNDSLFVSGGASITGNIIVGRDINVTGNIVGGNILYIDCSATSNGNIVIGSKNPTGSTSIYIGSYGTTGVTNTSIYIGQNSDAIYTSAPIQQQGTSNQASFLPIFGCNKLNVLGLGENSVDISGGIIVGGNSFVGQNLQVAGDSSLNSSLRVSKNASVGGNISVLGDSSLNANLYVKNNTTIHGLLDVSAAALFRSSLAVVGDVSLNSLLRVGGTFIGHGDVSLNSGLRVSRNVTVDSSLIVLGDSSFNGNVRIGRTVTVGGSLNVSGTASIGGSLNLTGAASIGGSLSVTSDASFGRVMRCASGVFIEGLFAVNNDVSFNRNMSMNGSLRVANSVSILGSTDISGSLVLDGSASIGGFLRVSRDLSLNSLLSVGGNATILGSLSVSGNIVSSQNIQAVAFNATSDYRIKQYLHHLGSNESAAVLTPYKYTNILAGKQDYGFIAHEVQQWYPEMVSGAKDDSQYQSLNYQAIIPLLVNDVKRLYQIVDSLQSELAELKSRI